MKYYFTAIICLLALTAIHAPYAQSEPSQVDGSRVAIPSDPKIKLEASIEAIQKIIKDANDNLNQKLEEIKIKNYQVANAEADTNALIDQLKKLVSRFESKGDMYAALTATKQSAQDDVIRYKGDPTLVDFSVNSQGQVDRAIKAEEMASEFVRDASMKIRNLEDNKRRIVAYIRFSNREQALGLFEQGLNQAKGAVKIASDFADFTKDDKDDEILPPPP